MNLSRIIGIFIFSLVGLLSYSQGFYREYGNSLVSEGGLSVVESPDGNIFIGGYKDDSAMVTKMDLNGNILWVRAFKPVPAGDCMVHQLNITPDGYLIGVGNCLASNAMRDVFHFKFDINGNLIWINRINDLRPIFGEAIQAKSTTEYLIVADVYDLASPTAADVIIFRVDALTGAVIANTPRYDYITSNSFIDDPYAATLNANSTRLYTTGRIYVNGSFPTGMRPYLTKFDLNGNPLSTSYLGWTASQNARIYGTDIVYNSDSLAICYFGDVSNANSNFTVGLIRTDTAGNIAWSRNYNVTTSGSEIASKVIPTATGYFIIGYMIGGTNDFFIISTDRSGNTLWAKKYGGAATTESFRATTCPIGALINNQIYFTGETGPAGAKNLVVASCDLTGTIGCQPGTVLTITTSSNPTNTTPLVLGALFTPLNFTFAGNAFPQPLADVCSTSSVFLGNDTTICNSITLNASISGATSYLWQNGSTNSTLTTSGPGTYWVVVRKNCCVYTDTIVISGGTLPVASFDTTGNPCAGQYSFTNNSTNYTSIAWDFGDGNISAASSPSHIYSNTGTYNVQLIVSNACGSDTMIIPVSVSGTLGINVSPPIINICAGDSATLSTIITGNSGNVSYSWSSSSTNSASITFTPIVSGWVYVTVTDASGCSGTDSSFISITQPASLTISSNVTICSGGTATLTATASNNGQLQWSNNLGNSGTVNVSPAQTTTYYVSVFDSCLNNYIVDSVTVFLLPPDTVLFSIDSTEGCSPLTVHFTDQTITPDQITGWFWDFGDGNTSTSPSPTHTYTSSGVFNISLTVTSASGCITTLTNGGSVNVLPVPQAGFSWTQTFGTNDEILVTFIDESLGATSYFWSFGDSSSSVSQNPQHGYGSSGEFTVTQIVSNGTCNDTLTLNIELHGEFTLYVPNTFTPGGNSLNNTFGGIGIGIANYHLMVFDRWGMLIFESNDYALRWDGTFKGNPVQQDTYVWVIDAEDYIGQAHHKIGHVNVIR